MTHGLLGHWEGSEGNPTSEGSPQPASSGVSWYQDGRSPEQGQQDSSGLACPGRGWPGDQRLPSPTLPNPAVQSLVDRGL